MKLNIYTMVEKSKQFMNGYNPCYDWVLIMKLTPTKVRENELSSVEHLQAAVTLTIVEFMVQN